MSRKVAIVGSAFRLPGSTAESFWPSLLEGRDLVTEVEASRWAKDAFLHPDKAHPGSAYTFAAGSIGDVSGFDATFFGISPREAAAMDPQQRLLLELAWETFEQAGIRPSTLRGSSCGVYIGLSSVDYGFRMARDVCAIDSTTGTGNASSIAANRLSYIYDLHGPSMVIDTACSSSLVAFHQACRAIQSGEIDQALTGGVSLHLHPYGFIIFSKASMLSRRGRCNVFDAGGDGYVRSEGAGLFFLKAYDQALRDGDRILAVVAGSAVNTDGRKSGLTVPSPDAQVALMRQAYAQAGIAPEQIDYLEAHGTGTAVGDPIESRAIGQALGQARPAERPLPVGSVKSNLGHLEAASGVAGLVKALYCLRHRTVPATIGLREPNPHIPFDELNLQVVTERLPLKPTGTLTIGVNSFGFGGANAHVILQSHEAPAAPVPAPVPATSLPLLISARDEKGLTALAAAFAERLDSLAPEDWYAAAHQALFRREWHPHRVALFAGGPAEASLALRAFAEAAAADAGTLPETGKALGEASGPVFVYAGNGSQWLGMGAGLLADPVFAATVADIDGYFKPLAGYSLLDDLAGRLEDETRYQWTEIAQPALFAVQVGVTRMLAERGIRPLAVFGHSVGEVAAAWACGALDLATATRVIYHRSRLQALTRGSGEMSAVGLGASDAQAVLRELGLDEALCIAGENSGKGVTLAGAPEALTRLEQALTARQVFVRRLDLAYAFHSPAMDPVRDELLDVLGDIAPQAATVPYYSTVTGGLLDGEALGADYWWRNIRQPVLFQQACEALVGQGHTVFVDVGPHPILRGYVNDALARLDRAGRVVPTLLRHEDLPVRIDRAAAQVVIAGIRPDWQALFPHEGRFIELPGYVWQKERHWQESSPEADDRFLSARVHPLLGWRLPDQPLAWENTLDTQLFPTLGDHVVGDAVLFPGAGFAELALAAALQSQPGAHAEIEDLEIRVPLLLAASPAKKVQVRIDEADGRLSIASRTFGQDEAWVVHATGRVRAEARGAALPGAAPLPPARPADFDGPTHLALTRAVGLQYGPAYQAVDAAWVDGERIIARLRIPAEIAAELPALHLHPALLDSAFQLIMPLLRDQVQVGSGLAFIPVRFGRLTFADATGAPHSVEVSLRRRSAHSLLADFSLFDARGQAVAAIDGARFRAVRLHKGDSLNVNLLGHAGVPSPYAWATPAPLTVLPELAAGLGEALAALGNEPALRRYAEEVDPLLDSLCGHFLGEAVQRLGGCLTETMCQTGQVLPAAYLDRLIAHGQHNDYLLPVEKGWQATPSDGLTRPIWQELFRSYPEHFQIVHTVGRLGMHLDALLKGECTGRALLPRESSPARLARLVLGAAAQQAIVGAMRQRIARLQAALPAGRRLRVLEFGVGGSVWVADLYDAFDFTRSDYHFRGHAPEDDGLLRESCPRVVWSALDDETPPALPGEAFDLILLPVEFAPLADVARALSFARDRLSAQGALLLLAQHPSHWADFVFGTEPDWWQVDAQHQPVSRQMPLAFWQQELQRAGLSVAEPLAVQPEAGVGAYLLLATPADARAQPVAEPVPVPQAWLLIAAADGEEARLAVALADGLRARGQGVSLLEPAEAEPLAAALRALPQAPTQVLLLSGLCAEDRLAVQAARCLQAAALVQACETAGLAPDCWLPTRNATVDLLHPAATPVPSLDERADALFWGFGRTLANESAAGRIRLLDLLGDAGVEALLPALLTADAETELAVAADGQRYVPRLQIHAESANGAALPADAAVSLRFELPGQLRNLRWEARAALVPGDDEVLVEVQATGLNFRDVMYALGLLSDEAIENGFSGPTLGFEFAGIVRGKGARVGDRFAVGDRVVGFGPASFANRLVTQADAVARIPGDMSFEAAATIPSTFFTVYYALHHLARLEPGERVLIHGAAGGVGIAAIQIAQWLGAEIHATAGSDEKRDFLRLLGVEHLYDSRSLAFADEVLAATGGQGVDVVLNSLAGEAINRNLSILRPFGRFLELGKRDFYENTRIGLRPFRNNISYFGIDADQLMSERPALTRRLFGEMMALFENGTLCPLPYRAFDANQVVDAFRYMQQARQIGKVVVTYRNGIRDIHVPASRTPASALRLCPASTYLVTGGLTGFGLRTAQWLIEKGARHLVLVGRRGPDTEEAQPWLATWQAQGLSVRAEACDITDRARLEAVLARIAEGAAPLRGIVHAATVFEDGLIRSMSAVQLQRVLEPKVRGALLLHELTQAMPLEFFVLFSSATTLFGNPGQANYVAANHWLEALARYRLGQGLPATCVLWGAIDDAGFLARNERIKEALQGRMGGAALPARLALDTLERLLRENRSGLGVMELDWRALARFLPTAATPRFSELASLAGSDGGEDGDTADLQAMLETLSDDELLQAFGEMLKQEVGEILRLPPAKIEADRPLQDMGLDSLMGVEMVVALESRFGIRLPVMALSESATIERLAARILEQLRAERQEGGSAPATGAPAPLAAATLARHAAELTDDTLEALQGDLRQEAGTTSRLIQ